MKPKEHSIRILLRLLPIFAGVVAAFCPLNRPLWAQQLMRNGLEVERFDPTALTFEFRLSDFNFTTLEEGTLLLSSPATNSHSRDVGMPMLPQLQQIIELTGDEVSISIEEADWERYTLPGDNAIVAPAPPLRLKSEEGDDAVAIPDPACYKRDAFFGMPLAQITPLGVMRGTHLARLTISPFRYNPVGHELEYCRHCRITLHFGGTAAVRRQEANANPLLKGLPMLRTKESSDYENTLCEGTQAPVLMVVAPQAYAPTLQPFLSWKRQEGYRVETYYIDGEPRDTIRRHLKERYDNATVLNPAPLMVLLVGDIDEIPVWMGRHIVTGLDYHRTDLYYVEYTDDYLPDALLGRLSVSDTAELHAVLEKTLIYERYELSDSAYLRRSLLVAGKENTPPAPTVTNGQVNYLKRYLVEHDPGHDTFCYYNPESDSLGDTLRRRLSEGVGIVNYTAHCNINGWRHPMLYSSDIDTLTPSGRYFLAINNCCRTNEIIGTCFGEHLLRKAGGGAIGAIGASNETLWEEDYYWSMGSGAEPTTEPLFHAGCPGAYDRLFHTHEEPRAEHAPCQGQLLYAGNWAVSASGSTHDAFYWEIYSLLGDPTLMPYIGIPADQTLTVGTSQMGDNQLQLQGLPGARVAATRNYTLYGYCVLDSLGAGTLECLSPLLDSLTLTATAQFHKPLQTIVVPQPVTTPRLVISHALLQSTTGDTLTQLTLGDTVHLVLTLRNAGASTATQHWLRVRPTPGDGDSLLMSVGQLEPQQDTLVVLLLHPDSERDPALVTLLCETGDSGCYWSQQLRYDLLDADTSHHGGAGIVPATDEQLSSNFTFYPNPASSQVTLSGFAQPAHIELYDALGRLRGTLDVLPGETHRLDTRQLSSGIYTLRSLVTQADGRMRQTIKRLLISR